MSTCRARFSPPDDRLSSSFRPPTFPPPIDGSRLWRTSPPSCTIARSSFSGPSYLDTPPPLDIRAKSTPPCDQYRQHQPVYPSPPLTDSGLAATIPLPDVSGYTAHSPGCSCFREDGVNENMSQDVARHSTPLSPPPTVLVHASELPEGSECEDDGHHVESWTYGEEDLQDSGAAAPLFPPVRDDSGFEEFGLQGGCEDGRKLNGSQDVGALIEPTSMWIPHSPLSMEEGLPLSDLHSFPGVLPGFNDGNRSSGRSDSLVSPISPTDTVNGVDNWPSNSTLDWTYSPSNTLIDVISPPSSPKPRGLSLELSSLDSSLSFLPVQQPSPLSPVEIPFGQSDRHWFHEDSFASPSGEASFSNQFIPLAEDHNPYSPYPHCSLLHAPSADLDSEYSDTVMPSDDDDDLLPPPSPRRLALNDLHDPTLPHGDLCITPVPRSPHGALLPQVDFSMDDPPEAPGSPHSPHPLLPGLEGEDIAMFPDASCSPMETISPSLLGGAPATAPDAGLGLFLQSDPPLARSPSPDEDDFGFLDIQLDPELATVEPDEFLALRALRKSALAQERAARMAEAELGERITAVASALLPPTHSDTSGCPTLVVDADPMETDTASTVVLDPAEKRLRKRELHSLMDMRAEARRTRKLQKQRSKEIGALLDFKMHTPMSPMEGLPPLVGSGHGAHGNKGWTKTIAHLVAHMVLRRHDRSRPLENKVTTLPNPTTSPKASSPMRRPTSLRHSVSADDLLAFYPSVGVDEDEDDDMEM